MQSVKFNVLLVFFIACLSVLLGLSPWMQNIEQQAGINRLFNWRGQAPSIPGEAVVIAMDSFSSRQLGLEKDTSAWPRHLHAELINTLTRAGARNIIFDIFFREARDPDGDQRLADAIATAPPVSLYQMIEQELALFQLRSEVLATETLLDPMVQLASTSAEIAPFPLPAVPQKVTQFWTFKDSLGGVATLPVLALHQYLGITAQILAGPGAKTQTLAEEIRKTREQTLLTGSLPVHLDAYIKNNLSEKKRHLITGIYTGGNTRLFNLYGSARTVKTLAYSDFFSSNEPAAASVLQEKIKDKAVFIGFSEPLQWNQQDVFHTAFSNPETGLHIAGVELLATAFLNLLHQDFLQYVHPAMIILINFIWPVLVMGFSLYLPALKALLTVSLLTGLYLLSVILLFESGYVLPFIQQVFLGAPGLLLVGTALHFGRLQFEKKRIKELFGYYLPEAEITRLAKQQSAPGNQSRIVEGVCMSTDAENYTQLSEQIEPEKLASLVNNYYQILFDPIRKHRGHISDVVGDSVMAIWADMDNPDMRQDACEAALEIQENGCTLTLPNGTEYSLKTRIGLHWGQMAMSNLGALDHFEYRAVGDIVNTASRIEGVNKQLGTHVLASETMIAHLSGIRFRYLGLFKMAGKTRPLGLYELLPGKLFAPVAQYIEHFETAFALLQAGKYQEARARFSENATFDPVSGFYDGYLRNLEETGQLENWDQVVVLVKK